jgi:4'-phosphopantetheinyl transferase EntD
MEVLTHELPGFIRMAPPAAQSENVVIHLSPIRHAGFALSHFLKAGIDIPPTISRSTVKRQAEYFHGRLAARNALARFGHEQAQIGIGASREPVWPEGILGSITHNVQYAAAAVAERSTCTGIGIDVETVITPTTLPTLLNTVVSSGEYDFLVNLNSQLPLEFLLTVAFSAKESFFKASFPTVGRYFGFDAVRLKTFDTDRQEVELYVQEHLSNEIPAGSAWTGRYEVIAHNTVFSCFVLPR